MRRLIVIAFLFSASQTWAAFGYYSPISINAAQVPSTQTDFPVLVSVTDARFKTVGNSGHVQNSSGFDIRPYSDSGLTTAITGYELERYNASTGEVVMWVKVGSLSSSTTPIYLAYGDAAISTDGSSSTAWSNNFLAVMHLKDGTTLSMSESSGNNSATNHSCTAATGQIDGGAGLVAASSQYIEMNNAIGTAAMTFSGWVKATSFPSPYGTVIGRRQSGTNYGFLYVNSSGKLSCFFYASADVSYDGTGSHTLSTGTWYYLASTYNSSAGLVGYVNAASDGTAAANGTLTTTGSEVDLGHDPGIGRFWDGTLDECRVASVARSQNWITTEYNNQSAPGTFETLGTEVPVGATQSGWFYFLP